MKLNSPNAICGNIAKTMRSNGKQFNFTQEMLTAVVRDQRWPYVIVAEISAFFWFKICFCFVLLYNKSINDCSLGEQSSSVVYCYLT